MSALLRKSLADVTRRKGRTFLVVLAIFIGIFGLTAINFVEDTLLAAFAYNSGATTDQPDIVLGVDRLDPAVLPELRSTTNVQTVQYSTTYTTQWHVGSGADTIPLGVLSYPDLQHVMLGGFQLTAGRYPDVGEIVMLDGDQSMQPFGIGDTITIDGPDGPTQLRVVGLARQPGQSPSASHSAVGFMSDADLRELTGALFDASASGSSASDKSSLHHIIEVKVANSGQEHITAGALETVLQDGGITVLNQHFPTDPVAAALVKQTIDGVFSLLRILVGLAIMMSGVLLVNTVTTLIAEQTATIGTMKAIGGRRGPILRSYLVTVFIYGLLGTLPGTTLGILAGDQLAKALAPQIPLALGSFTLAPWIVALSLAVGLGVPLLAALFPVWSGIRVSVREALAAYGVSSGAGVGFLARLGQRLPRVSQVVWLGTRGLFRRRARMLLTLVTLAAAAVCFLVVQTAVTSVSDTINSVNANFDSDMRVIFSDPTSYVTIQDQLSARPNVARVERDGATNATTQWGTISVSGYEAGTQIYHPQLTSGRWLQPGDTNVALISDDVAHRSGLQIGDTLTLQNNFGTSTSLNLTVIGTLDQSIVNLGWIGAAIVPVDTLYELRGVPANKAASSTLQVEIEARDRSQAAVHALAARVNALVNPEGSSADGHGYFSGNGGTVDTTQEYVSRRGGDAYLLYYILYAAALLVGVAGTLGLANALAASVLDRRREIGVLRAIGAVGRKVARVFWIESVALVGLAWLVAAIAGVPLSYAFVQVLWEAVFPVHFSINVVAFLVMLAAILVIATLASILPALRASRMRLADILRYE